MPGMRLSRAPVDGVTVDDLQFAVRWSRRRRTIGISVARDGGLRVLAPAGVSGRRLEQAVRAKLPWVRRKLAEFEALGPPPAALRLAEGERLPYLGRSYAIHVVGDPRAPFALRHGRFELARGLDGDARAEVMRCYTAHARAHLAARVAHFAPLVGATPAAVAVRDLGTRRWGVCNGHTGTVSFHWELVMQRPEAVDYVVVHELAHLHEPHHQRPFWRRVEAVLPDYKQRRALLSAGRRVI
jgi:predicted metal-dependent hydrolase